MSSPESATSAALTKLLRQIELIVDESGEGEGLNASAWLRLWIEQPSLALGGRTLGSFSELRMAGKLSRN